MTKEEKTQYEELQGKVEQLQDSNKALEDNVAELRYALKEADKLCARQQAHFETEHRLRMRERNEHQKNVDGLKGYVKKLEEELEKRRFTECKAAKEKANSIPRLVVISVLCLVVLAVPYVLESLGIMATRYAFMAEAPLMMAIAWCYALIWERAKETRK